MRSHFPPMSCLLAFEAAARRTSFASAATELNLTPSAVSHHQVMSETEVRGAFAGRRQPDSATLRTWEIAGAAHVDYWWIQYRQGLAVRDGNTPPTLRARWNLAATRRCASSSTPAITT